LYLLKKIPVKDDRDFFYVYFTYISFIILNNCENETN